MKKKSPALTEKQSYWLSHLKSAESQQLSLAQYAQEQQINVKLLYQWKWTLNKKGLLGTTTTASKISFSRVEVLRAEAAQISICLPNGVRIEVNGSTNAEQFQQMISTLSRLS